MSRALVCPLCSSEHTYPFARVGAKTYWRCGVCRLTFLAPEQRLEAEAELAEYQLHQNDPEDAGYRKFLSRLTKHLTPRLSPGAEGLDYGSGPGPTLSMMLEEVGFTMEIYDPFFAPNTAALDRRYDFITCTETIEHFHYPAKEFQRLDRLLRPGGWLGVMTEIQTLDERFTTWWYLRDPTHVCFYKRETMAWIATRFAWEVVHPRQNVTLFYKPDRSVC